VNVKKEKAILFRVCYEKAGVCRRE